MNLMTDDLLEAVLAHVAYAPALVSCASGRMAFDTRPTIKTPLDP